MRIDSYEKECECDNYIPYDDEPGNDCRECEHPAHPNGPCTFEITIEREGR